MPIREVSRSEEGGGSERNPFESLFRQPRQEEPARQPPLPGDTAEVTRPDRVALRLLRARVLKSAAHWLRLRSSRTDPRSPTGQETLDPEAWAALLLQDLSLLAAGARLAPTDPPIRSLFARACRQGMEETLEILGDLDVDREPLVRGRILAAAGALAARLASTLEQS